MQSINEINEMCCFCCNELSPAMTPITTNTKNNEGLEFDLETSAWSDIGDLLYEVIFECRT